MSFVIKVEEAVKEAADNLQRVKDAIIERIASLPDNPRIRRFPNSSNAFVINSRDLGSNWSPKYHDFRRQYAFLVSEIERRGLPSILSMLEEVIERGFLYDTKSPPAKHTFHPDVIEHLILLIIE